MEKTKADKFNLRYALFLQQSYFSRHPVPVEDMSPEEVRDYVKGPRRTAAFVFFCVSIWLLYHWLMPASEKSVEPVAVYEKVYENAGRILDISVHHTTFTADTTVTTETGIYQVTGAVSGSVDDNTKVRRYENLSRGKSKSFHHAPALCIESGIKEACYRIL